MARGGRWRIGKRGRLRDGTERTGVDRWEGRHGRDGGARWLTAMGQEGRREDGVARTELRGDAKDDGGTARDGTKRIAGRRRRRSGDNFSSLYLFFSKYFMQCVML